MAMNAAGRPTTFLRKFSTLAGVGTRLAWENDTIFGDVDFGMFRSVSEGRVKIGNGRASTMFLGEGG
jgi:hypothetical protein